jgi:hypothetical protein
MKYKAGFLYTVIATAVYFKYFYREDVSALLLFTIPFFLFLPIFQCFNDPELILKKLNILTVLAFCVGFIFAAFLTNNNIWPIALIIQLIVSVPSILIINILCLFSRRMSAAK